MFEGSIRIYLPYIFQHIDVIVLKTLRFHPTTQVKQSGYHRIHVDDRPNWTKKIRFHAEMDTYGRDLYLVPVNNKPREFKTIFTP